MTFIISVMPIWVSTITNDLKLHKASSKTSLNEQLNTDKPHAAWQHVL
jgi:hypothetical protein